MACINILRQGFISNLEKKVFDTCQVPRSQILDLIVATCETCGLHISFESFAFSSQQPGFLNVI